MVRTPRASSASFLASFLAVLVLAPLAQAGDAAHPDLVDAAGDVKGSLGQPAQLPCKDAVDLLSFWSAFEPEGIGFHYRFKDLSVVTSTPAMAQDGDGRCMYSYTDFEADVNGSVLKAEVYVDHSSNPAFATGWRFDLQGQGVATRDLPGKVDAAAGTIDVTLPFSIVGQPRPGDRVGAFRVQAVTAAEGAGLDYEADWAPDSSQACACWVEAPGAGPNATSPHAANATRSPTQTAPSAPTQPRIDPTTAPATATATGAGTGHKSPAAGAMPVLLGALALLVFRRRARPPLDK